MQQSFHPYHGRHQLLNRKLRCSTCQCSAWLKVAAHRQLAPCKPLVACTIPAHDSLRPVHMLQGCMSNVNTPCAMLACQKAPQWTRTFQALQGLEVHPAARQAQQAGGCWAEGLASHASETPCLLLSGKHHQACSSPPGISNSCFSQAVCSSETACNRTPLTGAGLSLLALSLSKWVHVCKHNYALTWYAATRSISGHRDCPLTQPKTEVVV